MITPEESRKVGEFLKGKNLPLDLKVEILDHISEQLNYKTDLEGKDFPLAFAEIKDSWVADLKMNRPFIAQKRTKIQRDTVRRTNFEILKKAALYFGIYFVISFFLMFYSKTFMSDFVFGFFCILVLVFAVTAVFNFKILRSATNRQIKRKISYLQPEVYLFMMASFYISFLILINFNERFGRYYKSMMDLVNNYHFTNENIFTVLLFNIFAIGWFYGFLYFLEYKKSIKILEQKINLKL